MTTPKKPATTLRKKNQASEMTVTVTEGNAAVATIAPKPISDKQREWLLKAGVEESKLPALSRDASKLMDRIMKERRERGYGQPTENQLAFLERNGYNREAMKVRTKEFCSKLIYQIKKEQGA